MWCIDNTVSQATTYTYRVYAMDRAGQRGRDTDAVTVTTLAPKPIITATQPTPGSGIVDITWTPVVKAVRYTILWKESNQPRVTQGQTTGTSFSVRTFANRGTTGEITVFATIPIYRQIH